ncbi:MAG: LiaI-LiaF-like domain-containing protein [Candidatus Aquicultor sp.]
MNLFGRFIGILFALVLIFVGVVLLLSNLGFLTVDPFRLIADFWPVLLIIVGLYFIWLRLRPPRAINPTPVSQGLEGASRADVSINFGAGALGVHSQKTADNVLFEGHFYSRPEVTVSKRGDVLEAKLRQSEWPWTPHAHWQGDDWNIGFNEKTPLTLRLSTGANRAFIDLTDNNVELVELNTGASDMTLKLPKASGFTRAIVKGGAADIKLEVPQGVAARIKSTGALSSLNVNTGRFPRTDSGYASPDYDTAQNKVDIEINTGVSSISVW